jgi:hypothetical protein
MAFNTVIRASVGADFAPIAGLSALGRCYDVRIKKLIFHCRVKTRFWSGYTCVIAVNHLVQYQYVSSNLRRKGSLRV